MTSDLPVTVESELLAPGITFQIRNYSWPTPLETMSRQADHVLNLSTRPRPLLARGTYRPNADDRAYRDFGELVLAPADITLYSRATGGPHRAAYFGFAPRKFQTLSRFGQGWDDRDLEACLDIGNSNIRRMMLQLAEEAVSPGFASVLFVEALGTAIVVELARHFGQESGASEPRRGKLGSEQLGRISSYIGDLVLGSPTTADLADLCGVSPRHLMRVFKATTGQTLGAHIEQMRVGKAKTLLSASDLPIKEIAFRLGFATPANFSTAFKRAIGLTPMAYRREHMARAHARRLG